MSNKAKLLVERRIQHMREHMCEVIQRMREEREQVNTPETNHAWDIVSHPLSGDILYKIVEIENRKYIFAAHAHSLSVVHAESCRCRVK